MVVSSKTSASTLGVGVGGEGRGVRGGGIGERSRGVEESRGVRKREGVSGSRGGTKEKRRRVIIIIFLGLHVARV